MHKINYYVDYYSQDVGMSDHNLVYADLGPAPIKKKKKHLVPVRDTRDDQVEYAQLNYHAKNREVQVAKSDKHSAGMFSVFFLRRPHTKQKKIGAQIMSPSAASFPSPLFLLSV